MTGFVWYVFNCKNHQEKYWAFAKRIPRNYNLVSYATMPNVITMNACNSKEEALKIAEGWNEQYKANGNYNAIWTDPN